MEVSGVPAGQERAGIASSELITPEELGLATRNHGMPLEALRYDVTPVGLHYLLIHFDIPAADASTWALAIDGRVRRPMKLAFDDITSRPSRTLRITMECAGNGRARMVPRPLSQPWLDEAVGTAEWTGTPLHTLLEEADVQDDAIELVFTGADHGIQGDIEQDYQRSLSVAEASREDVLLAWAMNGQPLPPQHGYPLRLIVPGWYGMTNVKWLRQITAVSEPFDGYQQWSYRLREDEDDPGTAVEYIKPRAAMIPPGFPDFFERTRFVDAGTVRLQGRAWSGPAAIDRVELSVDAGLTWGDAAVEPQNDRWAWVGWIFDWAAKPGEHTVLCRAYDRAGNSQPLDQGWNHHGYANNMAQRLQVRVR
jgi:DMSO/TMAO reductase YedYZ molybdopterin-dependent catalytic subunit